MGATQLQQLNHNEHYKFHFKETSWILYECKITKKWGPRKIDIDILCYNDLTINTKELVIPHPQIQNRNFVLIPLMELEPDLILPGYENSIEELYEMSRDTCEVYIFEA